MGIPSPFEDVDGLRLYPRSGATIPEEVMNLRRLSNALLIRLLRLIAYVRALGTRPEYSFTAEKVFPREITGRGGDKAQLSYSSDLNRTSSH